jgi:hypothetical protein
MRSTSSSVRPLVAVTVIDCRSPVSVSRALTLTMPSAEMSKITSISTLPRLACLKPESMNSPSSSFRSAWGLSP